MGTGNRSKRSSGRAGLWIAALVLAFLVQIEGAAPPRADHTCSGPGQPPCSCGFLCFDCDYLYLVLLNQCSDAAGWPASCGDEGERPCLVTEHIPSCKSGLYEIPFPGGNCTRLDANGFPTWCGDAGERACALNEHVPSCKTGLIEERGTCRAFDADGYPTSCGGADEPPCLLPVQVIAGITSCKPCHIETPLGVSCRLVEADRFVKTCGGCGQPACDVTVQAQTFQGPCKAGLTNEGGTCKSLDASGNPVSCALVRTEPDLGTSVVPQTTPTGEALWGFADLHTHPFSNLAFGGLVLWGEPFDPNGISFAVPQCDYACGFKAVEANGAPITTATFPLPPGVPVHGPFGALDLFGAAGKSTVPFHDVGGYPGFGGWPRNDEISHQQMYYRWIERAFRGGLKLMVSHAVNNEVLCRLSKRREGFSCSDMPTVDRQIAAVKEMEAYIDAKNGGPGQGWFRIAYSGSEARQIIESGKMAVVLGIEVDSLFGCGLGSSCTVADLRDRIETYHAMGVRHLFPIHLFDNDFGGTAVYQDFFNAGNWILNETFFSVEDCSGEGVEFALDDFANDPLSDLVRTAAETVLGVTIPQASYPPGGHCNTRGLTPLGESLVKLLMARKMIIDVDHMSRRTSERALEIADALDYPVVAGHAWFQEALADNPGSVDVERTEGAKEERTVAAIRDLGGLIAPILHQGKASEMRQIGQVSNDCSNSTKSWAQAYLYAVNLMKTGPYHQAVAVGSDLNGGISTVGPRFGVDACEGESHPDQGAGVSYPFAAHGVPGQFDELRSGSMAFDFNEVGLANVGLYPDFVEDLKKIGLTDADLQPLFASAGAYAYMWERIDAMDLFPPSTSATIDPLPNAKGWIADAVSVDLGAVAHPEGWGVKQILLEADGAQTIPPTVAPGATAHASVSTEGETSLRFRSEDTAGNSEAEQSIVLRLDWTSPSVAYSGNAGTYRADETMNIACAASDTVSGIDTSTCSDITVPAWHYPPGLNTVSALVTDRAGNSATAAVQFDVVVDHGVLVSLVQEFVDRPKVEKQLVKLLDTISASTDEIRRAKHLKRFKNKVEAKSGKALTAEQAGALIRLVDAL